MNEITITNADEYASFISKNLGAVVYFSTDKCNVCKILKPRLKEFLNEKYPKMEFAYVNINESQEVSANNQVFAAPTILFCFDGKEFIRKSRNINISALAQEIGRLYSMAFD